MRIWHISDTHGLHKGLEIPQADLVIHSGDASNSLDVSINSNEMMDFINWYASIPVKTKLYIPGNHDYSLFTGLVGNEEFSKRNIKLLINEDCYIEGLKIWGSPYTPKADERYTNWGWGLDRSSMNRVWDLITEDIHILVTHGPPKTILDLCKDRYDSTIMVQAGDKVLYNKILDIKPRYHLFGHIHDSSTYHNYGIFLRNGIYYCNGACVGGRKQSLVHNGHLIDLSL